MTKKNHDYKINLRCRLDDEKDADNILSTIPFSVSLDKTSRTYKSTNDQWNHNNMVMIG